MCIIFSIILCLLSESKQHYLRVKNSSKFNMQAFGCVSIMPLRKKEFVLFFELGGFLVVVFLLEIYQSYSCSYTITDH